jgi:integrase/recombinase XerD
MRLFYPVDELNASRHVGRESPSLFRPPTPERVTEFFEFLRVRIATEI